MPSKLVTVSTAGSDTTLVTVPAYRTFKVKGFVITNRASSNATVEVYDGPSATGEKKLVVIVPAGETVEISAVKPEFKTSIVVKSDQAPVDVAVEWEVL